MINFSFAQKKQIDSLKVLINKAKHDTTRMKALTAWGDVVSNHNQDSAIILYKQVKKIAENALTHLTSTSGKRLTHLVRQYYGISYSGIGYMHFLKHENELAMKEFLEAAKIRERVVNECSKEEMFNSKNSLARTYHMLGEFNRRLGNYDEAVRYGEKSLSIRNELNNLKLNESDAHSNKIDMAGVSSNLSAAYLDKGEIKKGKLFLAKALKLNVELKNLKGIGSCYNNMSAQAGREGDVKKQLEYIKLCLGIQKQLNDKSGIAKCLRTIGEFYFQAGKTDLALEYYNQSLNISREAKDIFNTSGTLSNLSGVYQNLGEEKKALACIKEALQLKILIGEKLGIAYAHGNLARYYQNKGDFKEALKEYQFTLDILEKMGDLGGAAIALNNMGNIYSNQGLPDEALNNYEKCLAIYTKLENKPGMNISYSGMAIIYEEKKNFAKALEYGKRSLKMSEELKDPYSIATSLTNIASVFAQTGNKDTALILYKNALATFESIKDQIGISTAGTSLCELLYHMDKNSEAIQYGEKSFAVAKKLGNPVTTKKIAKILRELYAEIGNSKKSLEMFELYVQMRDSVENEENKKNSIKTQLKYEYDKKASADSVKNIELQKVKDAQLQAQTASLKQEKTQRYALYGGLVLVVGFLGFVFNRFRVTNKQKKIIENQKQLVDEAFNKLHEKNQEVMDSIHYAKRIQTALMPNEKIINRILKQLIK